MTTLSFTELAAGRRLTGRARTLTDADLTIFTMLIGDWHPIHADEEYARTTPLGRRIFHGSFGVAVASGMVANLLELREPIIAALGFREWSFRAPLFIGDTVHAEVEILGTRVTSDGARGIVEWRVDLVNQSGAVVQTGIAQAMVRLAADPSKNQPTKNQPN